MSIKNLIAHFSELMELPVPIASVVEQIKKHCILDEISFIGVSLDDKKMKGAFFEYSKSPGVYAAPEYFAEVYYIQSDPPEWQRLVCCKELLHLLDKDPEKSGNKAQISDLIASLCAGDSLKSEDELQTFTDRLTVYYAMAILLPYNVREILLPHYLAGNITAKEIAQKANVPEIVAILVMSDKWPAVHSIFNGLP